MKMVMLLLIVLVLIYFYQYLVLDYQALYKNVDVKQNNRLTACLYNVNNLSIPHQFQVQNLSKDHGKHLELLNVFMQKTEALGLTFFMYGGTLLGSWRHHGFIPWDDDVDVAMDFKDREELKVSCKE